MYGYYGMNDFYRMLNMCMNPRGYKACVKIEKIKRYCLHLLERTYEVLGSRKIWHKKFIFKLVTKRKI